MVKVCTYSQLGVNGALGNQLWQIAGTVGIGTGMEETHIRFPKWDYSSFFCVPHSWFVDDLSQYDVVHDLAPDYLQETRWWEGNEAKLDILFAPSKAVVGRLMFTYGGDLYNRTAVHVRRANNLNLPDHHPVPPLEYFEAAIDFVGGDLVVFSDDMEWCKKQSVFKDALFSPGIPEDVNLNELTQYAPKSLPEAAYDLHAMGMCSRHILSNSSFSWWGAWLADSKRVVYPSRWYGPALSHIDTKPMFKGLGWKKLEFDPSW